MGHGWAGGWVGNNFTNAKAAALGNPSNFPVVVGVACQTGEITGNAPVDGTYYGTDGKNHTISTPNGCPSSTWDASQGMSVPLPMKVVPPSNYDKSLPVGGTTFPGSWLFDAPRIQLGIMTMYGDPTLRLPN